MQWIKLPNPFCATFGHDFVTGPGRGQKHCVQCGKVIGR